MTSSVIAEKTSFAALAKTKASQSRSPMLDCLRGVAILLVIFCHSAVKPATAGILEPIASLVQRVGWCGVDLFFVISGFLISSLLFSEIKATHSIDVPRFLARRALKLWPAYLLFVAFMFFHDMHHMRCGVKQAFLDTAPNIFHLQNYFGSIRIHTWSLAVEEHFYLFLPFALGLFSKSKKGLKAVPLLAFVVFAGCISYRCLILPHEIYSQGTHQFQTHIRIDGLMFGVYLGYLQAFVPKATEFARRFPLVLTSVGALLLVPVGMISYDNPFMFTLGYTFIYVGFGSIVFALVNRERAGAGASSLSLPLKILAFIGTYSYAIYLWHWDFAMSPVERFSHISILGKFRTELSWFICMALYVTLAVTVGVVMTWIVEKPILAWRDKFVPTRGRVELNP